MTRLLLFPLLLLCACETEEVRAWKARSAELDRRVAELQQQAHELGDVGARQARIDAFRAQLDLAGFLRAQHIPARLFIEPGSQVVSVAGTVAECDEVLKALAPVRWLVPAWRLRLEGDRCDWSAHTTATFPQLEQPLVAPPVLTWTPPPSQRLSRGLEALKTKVSAQQAAATALEQRLGVATAVVTLDQRVTDAQSLVEQLKARPPPCDRFIVERELSLDAPLRGKLLELTDERLVHPLEPKTDSRLRGFVEVKDGQLDWHCGGS